MSKWRNAKAFCSWLGLCPANKISGGKVLDSRTRQVVNRVADALRLASQSVGRTDTCLGIFYRRKKAHLGAPKATTATARKLACLIYHLLKTKKAYQEPDPALYQQRLHKSALNKLQRQAAALGYTLLPTTPLPPDRPVHGLKFLGRRATKPSRYYQIPHGNLELNERFFNGYLADLTWNSKSD